MHDLGAQVRAERGRRMRLALEHFSICGTKIMACRCGAYAVFRAVGPDGQVYTRARVIRISIRAGWRRFPHRPRVPGYMNG
jgi:hypothetical protein